MQQISVLYFSTTYNDTRYAYSNSVRSFANGRCFFMQLLSKEKTQNKKWKRTRHESLFQTIRVYYDWKHNWSNLMVRDLYKQLQLITHTRIILILLGHSINQQTLIQGVLLTHAIIHNHWIKWVCAKAGVRKLDSEMLFWKRNENLSCREEIVKKNRLMRLDFAVRESRYNKVYN